MKRSTFIKSILTAIASLFVAPSLLKKEDNYYPTKPNMKEGDTFSLSWEDSSKQKVVVTKGNNFVMRGGYITSNTSDDLWIKIHGQPSDNQKHLKWLIS